MSNPEHTTGDPIAQQADTLMRDTISAWTMVYNPDARVMARAVFHDIREEATALIQALNDEVTV